MIIHKLESFPHFWVIPLINYHHRGKFVTSGNCRHFVSHQSPTYAFTLSGWTKETAKPLRAGNISQICYPRHWTMGIKPHPAWRTSERNKGGEQTRSPKNEPQGHQWTILHPNQPPRLTPHFQHPVSTHFQHRLTSNTQNSLPTPKSNSLPAHKAGFGVGSETISDKQLALLSR